MSATYPMDMVRGRLTVQVLWSIYAIFVNVWNALSSYYFDGIRLSIWILADRQVSSSV
jgi:hypothetical protein